MKVSLIIPAFNEADSIESTLYELEKYMNGYMGFGEWEIIVANDGSTDNTIELLNRIKQTKKWLEVIDLVSHFGRGRALRAGLEKSTGDIIVSLDADLSYAPYHIEKLVEKMKKENADIVLASAYGKHGTVRNVPFARRWISKLGNKILAYMFGGGITVLTCLTRAYKGEFIERLDLHSDHKDIHLEILYKARMLGGKIVEIPADLCWRKEKLLKLNTIRQNKRRSTMRLRKTTSSHFFFALLNKPGLIFWIPGYILIIISAFIFLVTFKFIILDIYSGTSVYFAIRKSMMNAVPSWLTMVISFILGIQFFTLGFLTSQNKHNYEEIYKTLHAIFAGLKKNKE